MKKLSLLLLLVGCAHVELKPPPPDAALDERIHTYERYKPVNAERYRLLEARKVQWTRSLVLGNGFEVQDPADLRPVVLPGSNTANAIDEYERKNKPWKVIAPLAGFGFAAGATGLITSIIIGTVGQRSLRVSDSNAVGIVALTSVAVMIAVPVLSLITGFFMVPDTEKERAEAFTYYDGDLRRALRVDEAPQPVEQPPPVTEEEPVPQP